MVIFRKIAIALLLTAAVRAQDCGGATTKACGALGPCCSEFQFCGATPAQCGGGCQPQFSGQGACLASRNGGKKCISGYYKFDNSTWVVPSDAYNGNPQTADFTIDRAGLIAGNFKSGVGGKFAVTVSPPPANKPDGLGVRLSTTSYLTLGSTATVRMKPATGGGVVTAFITMADDKDEIDWEITGDPLLLGVGQSNFFSKGVIDYTNGGKHWPGSGRNPPAAKGANLQNEFHEYGISWQADKIVWLIDKEVVRTTTAAQLGAKFPTSNPRIQFAVWDGGFGTDEASKGRRDWAGGNINFNSDNSTRTAQVEWIKIQCGGDPEPTDAPTRPQGWYRPYIYANGIQSVVPGVFGYDATYTGPDKVSLANVMTELLENPNKPVKNATSNEPLTIVDGQVVPVSKSKSDAPSAFAVKSFGVIFSIFFAVLFF